MLARSSSEEASGQEATARAPHTATSSASNGAPATQASSSGPQRVLPRPLIPLTQRAQQSRAPPEGYQNRLGVNRPIGNRQVVNLFGSNGRGGRGLPYRMPTFGPGQGPRPPANFVAGRGRGIGGKGLLGRGINITGVGGGYPSQGKGKSRTLATSTPVTVPIQTRTTMSSKTISPQEPKRELKKEAKKDNFWLVTGGTETGGILVREGEDLKSAPLERLATDAIVKEIELKGERLNFLKVEGGGPDTGWVSIKIKGKDLLRPTFPNME